MKYIRRLLDELEGPNLFKLAGPAGDLICVPRDDLRILIEIARAANASEGESLSNLFPSLAMTLVHLERELQRRPR